MNLVQSLLISISCFVTSCASRSDPEPPFDPTVGMYDSVVSDIHRLSEIGRKESWIASGGSSFVIESEADMERALQYFGESRIPEENLARKIRLSNYLRTSESSYLFGFDGDFSVITFFDSSGRQTYIYPEAMSPKSNKKQNKAEMATPRKPSDQI